MVEIGANLEKFLEVLCISVTIVLCTWIMVKGWIMSD